MMGRANLCDPDFVAKAAEGREADIRPCIGCLRCLNGIMLGRRISCTVNPSLEPDNEDTLTPAEIQKNVLVIGGGLVGTETAEFLLERGCQVAVGSKKTPFSTEGVTVPVKFVGDCSGERTASIAGAVRSGYHAANDI